MKKYLTILVMLGSFVFVNAADYEGIFVLDNEMHMIGQTYPNGHIVKAATPILWAHNHKIHHIRGFAGVKFLQDNFGRNWDQNILFCRDSNWRIKDGVCFELYTGAGWGNGAPIED